MPIRFCDNEDPCPSLRRAVTTLLAKDWNSPEFITKLEDGAGRLVESCMFQIIALNDGRPLRVFIEYCPFCGSRIDSKFLENIRERGISYFKS